jgi:hypothetical protein
MIVSDEDSWFLHKSCPCFLLLYEDLRLKSLCLLTGKPQEKLRPGDEEVNSV